MFPVGCGPAGFSSGFMRSLLMSIFLGCLCAAGRMYAARPISPLFVTPLLHGNFIALSIKGKELCFCGLEEF